MRVLAVESSNKTFEDCLYDFVARSDLWYNDSTRDPVGDFGVACMSCASKSPIWKHNHKKSANGGSFRLFLCELKMDRLGWTVVKNSHKSDLHCSKLPH